MVRRVFPERGEILNVVRSRMLALAVPASLLIFPTTGHPQKSYLDAIQLEAEKLDQPAPTAREEQDTGSDTMDNAEVREFEQELEAQFRGSFLFYKKLPPRSQEEVFLEHQQGASIEDVRKTILNRYLHSR